MKMNPSMGVEPTITTRATDRWPRWLPLALVVAVAAAYAPSLHGEFLNYDDNWLIRDNGVLADHSLHALRLIWTDLSLSTRMSLGAEYLPLRDSSHWLELLLTGTASAALMRTIQLGLYVAAVLLFRIALLRCCGRRWLAELTCWLFALHPVHAESVAWLAGRKDVLAMLFVAGALAVYSGRSRHRLWSVPLLLLAACLSKAMSVAAVALLPAVDLMARRRPDWRVLSASAALCAPVLYVSSHVGALVGMTVPPWGGSRSAAAATIGPVWLRYIATSVWPSSLSVAYDVPVRGWNALAVAGWATVGTWAAIAAVHLRRQPLVAASWLWFFAPLVPVSQVLFSIENRMADRYLFLSVMGPALLAAAVLERLGRRGLVAGAAAALVLASVTASRAHTFSDSVLLFEDATEKTSANGIAPYQLGKALVERGREQQAMAAFRETIARAQPPRATGRSAITSLAQLLARRGQLREAEGLLRHAARSWSPDPIVLGDLAEVLALEGRTEEARAQFEDVLQRFPSYGWARERFTVRFGAPPAALPPDQAKPPGQL